MTAKKRSENDFDLNWTLFRIFLVFQRRSWQLLKRSAALSTMDHYVLADLEHGGPLSPSDLSKRLHLSKSRVSQVTTRLTKQGLLRRESQDADRRQRYLILTNKGARALIKDRQLREPVYLKCFEALSLSEQQELRKLSDRFTGGLKLPPIQQHPHEPLMTVPMRQLTRGLGLLGGFVHGTQLIGTDCHLVDLLKRAGGCASLTSLIKAMPFNQSTLSRRVRSLEEKGFVVKIPKAGDSRRLLISLKTKGWKSFKEELNPLMQYLQEGSSRLSLEEMRRFMDLLENSLENSSEIETLHFSHNAEVKHLENEAERRKARALVIEQLVARGLSESAPARLFDSESPAYQLSVFDRLIMAGEFQCFEGQWRLVNFARDDEANLSMEKLFLRHIIGNFFLVKGALELFVFPACLAYHTLQEMFPGKSEAEQLCLTPSDLID